ncbi:tyrosine-type recombinase/integrase [Entomomonas asaccharolytica]|uniref:Tyrosine-type recombinase/integrase n=1 Tax=Entomomonas asaccharolytica TaxID=2785331 RepID=A0A974NDZ9_9GAMM|nr:tyrosine-type recombinase/integrase [Entomomonas asaccharolytica]QQP85046.1 tyrosine-type recombinase/integrase [Entomomonas asaccharolytica]
MRKKKPENRDLPPHMFRRNRLLKNGKMWIGYYYDCRKNGKRKEIPLGTDLDKAKIKWAELEMTEAPKDIKTLGYVFDRYENEIIPSKAPKTQSDNRDSLRQLRKVFDDAPIDEITSHHIAQYRDARTAKVRANREMSLLSHIYNIAKEWGYVTYNPVTGVRKNKEKLRDYYADDEVFLAVYKHSPQELKDAMMIAYFTGQRPADAIKIRLSHITEDHLFIGQNKTTHKLRIKLNNETGRTGLGLLIDDILKRKNDSSPYLITIKDRGMTYSMRRYRFENARNTAINEALANNDEEFAKHIKEFQFKDLRPKAASDMNNIELASKLLGHTKEEITKKIYIRVGQEVEPVNRGISNK